jgi:hypothetical protein
VPRDVADRQQVAARAIEQHDAGIAQVLVVLLVEFAGAIDEHQRRARLQAPCCPIAIAVARRLRIHHLAREYDHAHPVADRARKWIQTVGRRHVGDLGQIEIRLQRGIRITGTGLGLKKAEEAVPQPSIVAARASLLDLVD